MSRWIRLAATVLAAGLAVAAVLAFSRDQVVLSGTLLVFTAFAIYLRETRG